MSTNVTEVTYLGKLTTDINNYFLYVSSSIGIPLNFFSTIIFIRLINNKTNMGFLYSCQTVVDFFVLLLQLLVFRSSVVFGRNFNAFSMGACKFITFLRRFIIHASSMLPVLITFDRCIFVLYGHRARFRRFQQKRYLALMLILMFGIITIIDIPNFFYYIGSRGTCQSDQIPDIFADVISIVLKTFVPFIFMGIFNWLIVRKLMHSAAVGSIGGSTNKNKSFLHRKEYQFTIAVIVFDLYFLILNIPVSIYYVFSDINNFSGVLKTNALMQARYSLASAITNSISFCVQTLSFFLYLGCNKLFRNEVWRIVGKLIWWHDISSKKLARIQPGDSSSNHHHHNQLTTQTGQTAHTHVKH